MAVNAVGWTKGFESSDNQLILLDANDQIVARTHLSINSVKSYIRSAYRRIGVTDRANAILWGIDHGFRPTPRREHP